MVEIDFIQMITAVGFPIAVTAYLLLRMEKKVEELTIAIRELKNEITR